MCATAAAEERRGLMFFRVNILFFRKIDGPGVDA